MENKDKKLAKLKSWRLRAKICMPLYVVIGFALGLSAGVNPGIWVFASIALTTVLAFVTWKVACNLEVHAQATMVYRLPELQESSEWEKYCTTVDYQLEKAINKR